jgi:YD repeat-containing protein
VFRRRRGRPRRAQYDTEEQLTAIINEHGSVYRFVLGPTGEVDEEHGFDGLVRRYTRDALRRVVRVDKPERHSEYTYDKAGRVTGVLHSDGEQDNYAYRLDGALTEATNSTTSIQFERDALGHVISEKQGTYTVDSEYDAQGLRVRMKSSLGASLAIERNLMGDVLQVASDNFSASFKRDQLGRELERTLPGGVRSRWERDATGRPLQHTVTAGDHTLRAVGYQWDVNDRLRMLIDANDGPTHYQHDPLGNLARASYPDGSSELRMPDAVGNLFRTEHRTDREYGPRRPAARLPRPQGHHALQLRPRRQPHREARARWAHVALRMEQRRHARPRDAAGRQRSHVRLRRARAARVQDLSRANHALGVGRQRTAT